MTIKLFHFPLLVYKNIVQQVDITDTLSLGICSMKTRSIVQKCLTSQKFELEFAISNTFFRLLRYFPDDTFKDNVTLSFSNEIMQGDPEPGSHCWKLSDQVSVYVRKEGVGNDWTFCGVYWNNDKMEASRAVLQYIVLMFPKLELKLSLDTLDVATIRIFMPLIKTVQVQKVTTGRYAGEACDDLVRFVLDEYRDAKTLLIQCETSANFHYELHPPPFQCDHLQVNLAGWVTRDHMTDLFMTCKQVNLGNRTYDDADLSAIFAKWTEDSPIDRLLLLSGEGTYRERTLTNVVGHLPGAQVVRKARLRYENQERNHVIFRVVQFQEGRSYQIQQQSGKRALVCQFNGHIGLSIDYEIGEHVDRMEVDFEEEEEEKQNEEDAVDD